MRAMAVIAVVADTHGYYNGALFGSVRKLAPAITGEAVTHCIHAGDVRGRGPLSAKEVLSRLEHNLGPTTVVRGNTDSSELPARASITIEGLRFLIVHGDALAARPRYGASASTIDALGARPGNIVITGHTHIPDAFVESNVSFLNPGSAGPPRFSIPGHRCAILKVADSKVQAAWAVQVCNKENVNWIPWSLDSDGETFPQRPRKRRRS